MGDGFFLYDLWKRQFLAQLMFWAMVLGWMVLLVGILHAQEAAIPEAAAPVVVDAGFAALLSRWIHDPVIFGLVCTGVGGGLLKLKQVVAVWLRTSGQAEEDAAQLTNDPADDVKAKAHHKFKDSVADIIDPPKK